MTSFRGSLSQLSVQPYSPPRFRCPGKPIAPWHRGYGEWQGSWGRGGWYGWRAATTTTARLGGPGRLPAG
jgi:hypothetical protein